VLKSFAEENDLETISDLKAIDDQVTFGASAQCLTRTDCLLGYQDPAIYGLKFKDVKTIDYGPPLAAGLENDSLQAVQYQTTAAEIESGDFVVLTDDKGMLSADNVVPIIRTATVEEFGEDLTAAINELSAELTTEDLIGWNARTDIDKEDPATVAEDWLTEKGLI
jgi:osmoprotectant transport system substrate-binding protein